MKRAIILLAYLCLITIPLSIGAQAAEQEPVTITIADWPDKELDPDGYNWYQQCADKVMSAYPYITVKRMNYSYNASTYMQLAATGNLPTMYTIAFSDFERLYSNEYARDISGVLSNYQNWLESYDTDALNVVTREDKIYALPSDSYSFGIVYNIDLFQQAGLVDENGICLAPKTWDEVVEFAKIIEDKTDAYGFSFYSTGGEGGWMLSQLAWCFGAKALEISDENGDYTANLTDPAVLKAAEFVRDLCWTHKVLPENKLINRDEVRQLFTIDKCAMFMSPPDMIDSLTMTYGMDVNKIGIFSMPKGPDGGHASLFGGKAYMFSPSSTDAQVDACFKFLIATGYGPDINVQVLGSLNGMYQSKKARGYQVSPLDKSIWASGTRNAAEQKIISWYQNVRMDQCMDYMNHGYEDLHVEEPVEPGALNITLDSVVQSVLMNESSDIASLLQTLNDQFQSLYLDPYNEEN